MSAEPPLPSLPPVVTGGLPRRILGRTNEPLCMFTLGTAPCGHLPPPDIANLVRVALDEGVTAIDTSERYNNSQEGVGLALGRRKDVFLSTKVFANGIAEAEASLAKSIKLLRTDYFDVLYYHGLGNLNIAGAGSRWRFHLARQAEESRQVPLRRRLGPQPGRPLSTVPRVR